MVSLSGRVREVRRPRQQDRRSPELERATDRTELDGKAVALEMRSLSAQTKLALFSVIVALTVTCFREGLPHGALWSAVGQFLLAWLVHWIALMVLAALAAALALRFNRFFLGYEWESTTKHNIEFYYHVLVVALVAAALIALAAHYVPTDDFLED